DDSNLLPVVRVLSIDAWAAEPGPDTGMFRISRDRDTNVALTINFTMGGTAVNGTDYTNISGSVILPAGVSFTNVMVYPRNDATFETNETITLSLTVLPAYRVDPLAAAATVTLVDDEIGISVVGSSIAAEDGSSTGQFAITRTGSIVSNLAVNFRWAGTATTNDFTSNATNTVILSGSNTVTFPIFAINDGVTEGIETLVLTLASNAAYTILPQNSATILLVDGNESFWNLWRAGKFSPAEMSQLNVSGADADPDGDGIRNLLEYAYNGNPKSTNSASHFSGNIEGAPGAANYVIQFTRRKSPTDLVYKVEVTSDLIAWDSNGVQELLPAVDDGNGITETARFVIAPGLNGNPQKFVRLKVTLAPNP
ncbi:MAG: Na-Ca exchanger/integrin-beta4, partial [Verrucomicrobiales bacterium]|nr:Na-Ca exchanger/integrin-beta4 [Verrucomicrobiales bacterium]